MKYTKLVVLFLGIILIAISVSSRQSQKIVLEEGTFELIDPGEGVAITPTNVCVSGVKLNILNSGLSLKGRVMWDKLILKVSGSGNVTLLLNNETKHLHFIDGGYVELPTGNYSYSILGNGVNLTLLRVDYTLKNIDVQTDGSHLYVTGGDYKLVIRGNSTAELKRERVDLPLLMLGVTMLISSLLWVMRGVNSRGREEGS